MYVCSLYDVVCLVLLLPFGLGFYLFGVICCFFYFVFSSFSYKLCGWQGLGALARSRA